MKVKCLKITAFILLIITGAAVAATLLAAFFGVKEDDESAVSVNSKAGGPVIIHNIPAKPDFHSIAVRLVNLGMALTSWLILCKK